MDPFSVASAVLACLQLAKIVVEKLEEPQKTMAFCSAMSNRVKRIMESVRAVCLKCHWVDCKIEGPEEGGTYRVSREENGKCMRGVSSLHISRRGVTPSSPIETVQTKESDQKIPVTWAEGNEVQCWLFECDSNDGFKHQLDSLSRTLEAVGNFAAKMQSTPPDLKGKISKFLHSYFTTKYPDRQKKLEILLDQHVIDMTLATILQLRDDIDARTEVMVGQILGQAECYLEALQEEIVEQIGSSEHVVTVELDHAASRIYTRRSRSQEYTLRFLAGLVAAYRWNLFDRSSCNTRKAGLKMQRWV